MGTNLASGPHRRRSLRRRRVASVTVAVAAALAVAAAAAPAATAALGGGNVAAGSVSGDPVGFVNHIKWTASSLAPGLRLLSGRYNNASVHPFWTVTIQASVSSPFDGTPEPAEAGSAAWARSTEAALTAKGFAPSEAVLPWPTYTDDPRGVLGTRVRVGDYPTQPQAEAEAAALMAAGFSPLVEWTGFDPTPAPDVELLHAAIVDPHTFAGRVVADHGVAVAGKQTAPAAAAALHSLVATNAGYFTINSALAAVNGVNTGISVYHGQLESLADGDRAALVLNGDRSATIENLTTTANLAVGDSTIRVLGINRLPGSAEDCGVPGLAPTSRPRQNTLCTGANDLVLFTAQFGAPLPTSTIRSAIQVVFSAYDTVLSIGAVGGGTVPAGDFAIQAIGSQARWINSHLHVGDRVTISERVSTASGTPVALHPNTSIASAGPMLVQHGRTAIDAVREGVLDPRDLNDYTFSAYRHARTLVGIDGEGRLLLVTADGLPGVSEGLTLTEEAELMRSLGAVDAMNLDGGGSTEFAVHAQLINDASSSPLRPVGGTIQILPH